MSALRSKDTYLATRLPAFVRRLGSRSKALVAVEHSMLVSIWHMLTTDTDYRDLGGDHFLRRDPTAAIRRLQRKPTSSASQPASNPSSKPRPLPESNAVTSYDERSGGYFRARR